MLRVDEREQIHHGDRTNAQLLEPLHATPHSLLVERLHDRALEVHTFRNRDASPAPRNRSRARVIRVPDLFLVAATQLDLVPVPARDEESRGRAVHLDHRVVGRRRAVHEDLELRAEVRQCRSEAIRELLQTVHDAGRLVVERRRRLVEDDFAGGSDADQIGERAADVDTNAESAHRAPRRSARSRSVASTSTSSVRSSREPVSTTP